MHKRNVTPIELPVQLLTIAQVAMALNMGQTKVYDLIKWHGLPAVRIDGRLRVPVPSFNAWVENHKTSKSA